MHSYTAYGLCIHSEVELPSLPAGEGAPDISIFMRSLKTAKASRSRPATAVIEAVIEPDLVFCIYEGREIYLNSGTTLDEETVRTYLLGLIISAALRQRGLLVLHAACVVTENRAIGFVGNCGYGKSTLASYFHSQGYHMYNDDVMAIDTNASGGPVVLPGSAHVRLRRDAGSWLHEDFEKLPFVYPSSSKRVQVATAQSELRPVPLTHLYLLRPQASQANEIRPVPGREAVRGLIENTRVRNLFKTAEETQEHFFQCTRLAKSVSVNVLERKKGLENLPEIFDLVERDTRSVSALAV